MSRDRRYDIDVLRVFAVYLLFLFHTVMIFNPAPFYHVRNDEQSVLMLIVAGFISLWHMPLLFVLAGWSLVGSLRARGSAGFLRERVRKLLVPLVAGCVVFGPVIKYLELRSGLDASMTGLKVGAEWQEGFRSVLPIDLPLAAPFHETFVQFWPTYFTLERFTWAHLWFVAYLFTFTVLYRPLFAAWMRRAGGPAHVSARWVYAPIVPLALAQVFLRPHWPGLQNLIDDWANVAWYSTFLITGFALARYPAFEQAVHRETRRALVLALAATLVLLAAVLEVVRSEPLILACTAVAGWGFIVALLGYARRTVAAGIRGLPYLVESSFPIYVLHQVGIVVTGFWIVQLPLGIAPKLALVLVASVGTTLAFYHIVVRPVPVLRFLLGMKARDPHPRAGRKGMDRRIVVGACLAGWVVVAGTAGAATTSERTDAQQVGARSTAHPHGSAPTPVGRWWAEWGAAQVEIRSCGDALCGEVVWLRSPFDDNGCLLRDARNADPHLRERAVLGMEILRDLRPTADEPGTWTGGAIYDPTSGRTYDAIVTLEDPDRLAMRGYWGWRVLGRTVTWHRVGSLGPCER